MINLIKMLATIRSSKNHFIEKLDLIKGYSEEEIQEIEKRHNISVHGQLKQLLMTMGKCSGGLLLDEFYMYRPWTDPSTSFGRQEQLMDIRDPDSKFLENCGVTDLIEKQYFEICGENEHMNIFFMYTRNLDDTVYEWDTNTDEVKVFGTLFEYLVRYRQYKGDATTGGTVRGDEYPTFFAELTTGRLLE